MKTVIDRFSVIWSGEHEVGQAQEFRKKVGDRKLNTAIKRLIVKFLTENGKPE